MSAFSIFFIILLIFVIVSKGYYNSFYPRVTGVSDAKTDEYPYIVVFETRADYEKYRLCTGTLISSVWVLTAAHCLDPEIYCVRFGDVTVPRNDTRYFSEVLKMIPHPNYKRMNTVINNQVKQLTQNDIALVLVRKVKMQFFGKLSAIDYTTLIGLPVVYAGFSATSRNKLQAKHQTKHQIKPLQIGEGVVGYCSGLNHFSEPTFCVTPKRGSKMASSLPGDSGGPLFNRNKIVGVFCGVYKPIGAYAPVSIFLDWIRLVMKIEEQKEKEREENV